MENKIYAVQVHCDNEIEVLSALVQLYSTSVLLRKGKDRLRNKLTELLAYYIKYGYSKETKELAMDSMNTSSYNINVMNSELTRLEYLITSNTNFHDKELNGELKSLADYYKNPSEDKLFIFKIMNNSK